MTRKSPTPRGRPRSERAHQAILEAALHLVTKTGFRDLTLDAVAAKSGVGKMTIYRRWPNKAAVVMDAFLALVGPGTRFPKRPRALDSLKQQMRLQAQFFRGPYGKMIKAFLGEAQFDPELAEAFRERWINPRREMTREVLRAAIHQGDLRPKADLEAIIDMLYGPIYYRLQINTGPIDDAFADTIFAQAMKGLKRN